MTDDARAAALAAAARARRAHARSKGAGGGAAALARSGGWHARQLSEPSSDSAPEESALNDLSWDGQSSSGGSSACASDPDEPRALPAGGGVDASVLADSPLQRRSL